MNYQVRELAKADTAGMHKEWMQEANSDPNIPEVAYERAILWAEDVLDGKAETQASVMAVVDQQGSICAIFDLVPVRPHLPNGYFKILSLTVAPRFDLATTTNESYFAARDVLSDIISYAIVHGLEVLFEHKNATMVKLYASDRITLKMFERAWGQMDEEDAKDADFKTFIRGNWVEFTKLP